MLQYFNIYATGRSAPINKNNTITETFGCLKIHIHPNTSQYLFLKLIINNNTLYWHINKLKTCLSPTEKKPIYTHTYNIHINCCKVYNIETNNSNIIPKNPLVASKYRSFSDILIYILFDSVYWQVLLFYWLLNWIKGMHFVLSKII